MWELPQPTLPPVETRNWSRSTYVTIREALRSDRQAEENTFYGARNRMLHEAVKDVDKIAHHMGHNRTTYTVFPQHGLADLGGSLDFQACIRQQGRVGKVLGFAVKTSTSVVVIVEIKPPTDIDTNSRRRDAELQIIKRVETLFFDRTTHTVYLISAFGFLCKT